MSNRVEPAANGGQDRPDDDGAAGSVLERLRADVEAFGLGGYEARILVALLTAGQAPAAQVAKMARIGRNNVYPALRALEARGLAHPVAGRPSHWTTPGQTQVFDLLYGAEEARLAQLDARRHRAEADLERLSAEHPRLVPYVHLIDQAHHVKSTYERLLAQASRELLVFNRPPYSASHTRPDPVVLEALARGVDTRVLHQRAQLEAPGAEAFRHRMEAYHQAGAKGRVRDVLPIKLAVVDRSTVLLAMADPLAPDVGFPTNLLVEHQGFASFCAAAFDQLWQSAEPYVPLNANEL